MDDRVKTAFEFAQATTTQLISLASGIIALGITFGKDFIGKLPSHTRVWALWSWGVFLISVFFGLWTLLALTGSLEPLKKSTAASIRGPNVTVPSALQIVTFLIGLILTVVFGLMASLGAQ